MKFKELSDEQKEKFVNAYYDNGKVKEMLAELGIQENHIKIYEQFPPEVLDDQCEYCGSNLVCKRFPRNHVVTEEEKGENTYCPECGHQPYVETCDCSYCNEKPERKKEKLQNAIKEFWGRAQKKVQMSDMTFRERIYLDTVLRFALDEDMKSTKPFAEIKIKIVPDKLYLEEIITSLVDSNILLVSTDSDIEAFDLSSDEFPQKFFYDRVRLTLNVEEEYANDYTSMMLSSPICYKQADAEDALEVWREIASYECIEYLCYQLQQFGFEYQIGQKTKMMFRSLLENFSTSQIYNIIAESVSDVLRDLYLGKCKKKIAGYTVISYIQEYCNGTSRLCRCVGEYGRDNDISQSEVSRYFFNKVLRIEHRGFYDCPNLKILLGEVE